MGVDELANAIEVLPGRFFFASVRRPELLRHSAIANNNICFCIDNELVYEPFFADFGPLNLGQSYRFCTRLEQYLQDAEEQNCRLYFWCGADPQRRANASVLVGMYLVLYKGWSSEEAYRPVMNMKPFQPFRDASCGVSTFHLTVLDCIRATEKAKSVGIIDFQLGPDKTTFNVDEYEYYEQVENGDMNWILPNKFMAFSGPSSRRTEFYGYRTLVPEDYIEVFKRMNIWSVVRLNKKMYDKTRFTNHGIKVHEMYFPDGTCPSDAILKRFIDTAEGESHAQAVHCKAGLGRTGVLICCYMMKHFRFTASEIIGYIRIARPGSVIGPQQHYLKDMEQRMWKAGDLMRAQNQRITASMGPPDTSAAGGEEEDELAGTAGGHGSDASSSVRRTSPMKPLRSGTRPSVYAQQQQQQQGGGGGGALHHRSTGGAASASAHHQQGGVTQVTLGMAQGLTLSSNRYGTGGLGASADTGRVAAAGSAAAAVASINGGGGQGGRVRGGGGRSYLSSSVPNFTRPTAQSSYAARRAMAQTLSTDTAQRATSHTHFATDGSSQPLSSTAHPPPQTAPDNNRLAGGMAGSRITRPPGASSAAADRYGRAGPTARAATAGSNGIRTLGVGGGSTRPSVPPGGGPTSPNQNRYVTATGQPRKGHHMAMAKDVSPLRSGTRSNAMADHRGVPRASANPYRTQMSR